MVVYTFSSAHYSKQSCCALNLQGMKGGFILYFLVATLYCLCNAKEFRIDYDNDQFLKDGKPFRYISGSFHYFRTPPEYWVDRLSKMKAGGLNAVQFYIPWNIHEPIQGTFDFGGNGNLTLFLDLIQRMGFVAIVRAGPYTCGEWENGGLPWWLLKTRDIRMRSSDPRFLFWVDKWYATLFPVLLPFLWKNGGPIGLIQVENEYGSFSACDIVYTSHLRDLFRSYVGYDTELITDDGGALSYLKCGYIPDVYPTVDGGADASVFEAQRTYAPRGPLVNTEYYPGWLDLWGDNFSVVSTQPILRDIKSMWNRSASFNFYMFFGGTNFGYMNGAGNPYQPVTTTYDYDAPLSEAGDPTPKFYAIRSTIQSLVDWDIPAVVPPPTPKMAYGTVVVTRLGSVLDLLDFLSPASMARNSVYPKSFEEIDFPYGFVLYQTNVPTTFFEASAVLFSSGVADRGYVMLDGVFQGVLIAQLGPRQNHSLRLENTRPGSRIQILVENNGRQCSGHNDPKGIISNVTLNNVVLTGWTTRPIEMERMFSRGIWKKRRFLTKKSRRQSDSFLPSVYIGSFPATPVADTYYNSSGWGKGQLFLNKFNVGRYWPTLGPQVTLYVPKTMLQPTNNRIVLLELEKPGNCLNESGLSCRVSFVAKPFLNQTVPSWKKV